ncbi:MAG: hypothetical protein ACLGQU_08410 [Acidobacteriota bacterium]
MALFFALGLENFEDEVLFAERAGACNFKSAGELAEFGNAFFFQLGDSHECLSGFHRFFGGGGMMRRDGLAESRCYGGAPGAPVMRRVEAERRRVWEYAMTSDYDAEIAFSLADLDEEKEAPAQDSAE